MIGRSIEKAATPRGHAWGRQACRFASNSSPVHPRRAMSASGGSTSDTTTVTLMARIVQHGRSIQKHLFPLQDAMSGESTEVCRESVVIQRFVHDFSYQEAHVTVLTEPFLSMAVFKGGPPYRHPTTVHGVLLYEYFTRKKLG